MQLIRLGDTQGFNLDMLLAWEVTEPPPPPEPACASESTPAPFPAPEPEGGEESPAPAPAGAAPPLTLTLYLAGGGTTHDITLEGAEAEAMRSYLNSRSGALIRPAA
jgi:hypothetical protein